MGGGGRGRCGWRVPTWAVQPPSTPTSGRLPAALLPSFRMPEPSPQGPSPCLPAPKLPPTCLSCLSFPAGEEENFLLEKPTATSQGRACLPAACRAPPMPAGHPSLCLVSSSPSCQAPVETFRLTSAGSGEQGEGVGPGEGGDRSHNHP